MCNILYFLFLLFFIQKYDCYYIYKNAKMQNEALEAILRKYLKPIRRLTQEILPDHNVEVQVEFIGSNVPVVGSLGSVGSAGPPGSMTAQRKFNAPPVGHHRKMPNPHHKTKVHDVKKVGRTNAAEEETSSTTETATTPTISVTSPPQLPPASIPPPADIPLESKSAPIDDKKPVYMNDLRKALEEFEKKFFAKQQQEKLKESVPPATQVPSDTQEEGKKPLLKKDLWMALGMKFLTGCSDHSHNHFGHSVPTTTRRNMLQSDRPVHDHGPLPPPVQLSPRVSRIMQLLKRGIPVERELSKADEENMQWLQVKIPKSM